MLKILPNGQVMEVVEVVADNQPSGKATVEKPYLGGTMENKISITAPKTSIALNEQLQITFRWQKINLETRAYENDHTNNLPITVQINDLTPEELAPVDGSDYITFVSAEPGKYSIRAVNAGVSTDMLEVLVSA